MLKKLKVWIRFILSIGLVVFLLYTIDLPEVMDVLRRSDPIYLIIAYIVALGDRVMMAYKWNILLKAKRIHIPLLNVVGTYLITTFLGLFLPATIGGDAVRAYAVSREGHKMSHIVSSIFVERLLGFMALFVFVLAGITLSILVFGQNFFAGIWNLFWFFLALLAASLLFIFLSLNEAFLKRLSTFAQKYSTQKMREHKFVRKLGEIYDSYRTYKDSRFELGLFFALSMIESLFPLFWTYFLSVAFGIEVPLLYFFILIPIVLVLVRLPISVDGFGIQEGAFVYFLGFIGVAAPEALLLGFASHILALLSVLPGGVLYAFSGLAIHDAEYGGHAAEVLNQEEIAEEVGIV